VTFSMKNFRREGGRWGAPWNRKGRNFLNIPRGPKSGGGLACGTKNETRTIGLVRWVAGSGGTQTDVRAPGGGEEAVEKEPSGTTSLRTFKSTTKRENWGVGEVHRGKGNGGTARNHRELLCLGGGRTRKKKGENGAIRGGARKVPAPFVLKGRS